MEIIRFIKYIYTIHDIYNIKKSEFDLLYPVSWKFVYGPQEKHQGDGECDLDYNT